MAASTATTMLRAMDTPAAPFPRARSRRSFSRRTLLGFVVGGVVVALAGLGVSQALGDGLDPLSPSNPATVAAALGLAIGAALEIAARLGNHCPHCGAEMRHVGASVPILDYTARQCSECGRDRA